MAGGAINFLSVHSFALPGLLAAGVALDWCLGEPRRWHPLVGFGRLADWVEHGLRARVPVRKKVSVRLLGVLAWCVSVLPWVAAVAWIMQISSSPVWAAVTEIACLYFALGHRSLHDHARPVAQALLCGDEAMARERVSWMVSRDSAALEIAPAATESVLENGNDGVFGALFWFVVAGAPGAVFYRLVNTLDAMWGYKNERYLHFGWAAARIDDVINFVPARLTALTYALLGKTRLALRCWRTQAPTWESPNAGPVMAAGAGALAVRLGGAARYQGKWHQRPPLGEGRTAQAGDIERALSLVRHGVSLWLVAAIAAALVGRAFNA